MYEKFYGLKDKPFNVTPDPRFLYLSPHHREALAHLQYGVQERKGFVAIIGEVGTGKTTLIHALLNSLNSNTKTAFIFSTTLTAKGLLKMMISDFGIETKARTKTELLLELNHFLLQQFSSRANAVLIVDEAQNLSFRLLEEIRMLSNLETDREKLLQIILVGQPELAIKLAMPRLRQLQQRIGSQYHICPLNRQEVAQYIQHRLRVAGLSDGSIFDARAVEKICHRSEGIPRLINMICNEAMLLGYTYEKRKIGASIVEEAIGDLRALSADSSNPSEPSLSIGAVGQEIGGRLPWWRRVFRSFSTASGLLLGAALLNMPLLLEGSEGNIPSRGPSDSKSLAILAPWPVQSRKDEEADLSAEIAEASGDEFGVKLVGADQGACFLVHVDSFRELARAKRLGEMLRKKGLEPVLIEPVQLPELGRWQRMMVGKYGDRDAALQAAEKHLASGIFCYAHPRRIGQAKRDEREELARVKGLTPQAPAFQGDGDE